MAVVTKWGRVPVLDQLSFEREGFSAVSGHVAACFRTMRPQLLVAIAVGKGVFERTEIQELRLQYQTRWPQWSHIHHFALLLKGLIVLIDTQVREFTP